MELYSERIIEIGTSASVAGFEVPGNKRCVLRCADFANFSNGAGAVSIAVGAIAFAKGSLPATTGTWHWEGRQVAYGGEMVWIYTSGSDCRGMISGYLFNDNAPPLQRELERATQAPPGFEDVPL